METCSQCGKQIVDPVYGDGRYFCSLRCHYLYGNKNPGIKKELSERDKQIIQGRKLGYSLAVLSVIHKISKQRISQIVIRGVM